MTNFPVPALTIGELIKVGLAAVLVRCLHPRCKGEAVVRLASFPAALHDIMQGDIPWACTHCGRVQVVTEQPTARHVRFRAIDLDEMHAAVRESSAAFVPAMPIAPSAVQRILAWKR